MKFNLNIRKMAKKILLISFFSLITIFNLNGQIQKKTLMVGGEIDLPLTKKYEDENQFKIAPTFGYFVVDNLVVGVETEATINTWLSARRYNIGIGPLVRYYVGTNKLQPFGHLSYLGLMSFFNTSDNNYFSSHLKAGLGVHYLLIPSVSIDALLAYDYFNTTEEMAEGVPQPHLAMHIGFQIFLPPKNID